MFFPDRDRVFAEGHWQTRFRFDGSVAAVFDDMALRSIPLYRESLDAIAHWVRRFAQPGRTVFDLGCSTGSALVAAMSRMEPGYCSFVGIDTSAEMLQRAELKIRGLFPEHLCKLREEDITQSDLSGAGAVLLNYTLQFVPRSERLSLIRKIHDALPAGGLLFLGDKLAVQGTDTGPFMTDLYHAFKEDQGYSRLEIQRKRQALEEVLVPLSLAEELELLREGGFRDYEVILKWNQFASFVAVKS